MSWRDRPGRCQPAWSGARGRGEPIWKRLPAGQTVWEAGAQAAYAAVPGLSADRASLKEPPGVHSLVALCRSLLRDGVEAVEAIAFPVEAKKQGARLPRRGWIRPLRGKRRCFPRDGVPRGERGSIKAILPTRQPETPIAADRPFAHPHYWSACVLLGDPR